jgi:hypothetical protein
MPKRKKLNYWSGTKRGCCKGFFQWRMDNGEWRMDNGEWRMNNGEWRMENGE